MKKENFELKLQIHYLNERLSNLGPEANSKAIKENYELKIELQSTKRDLKLAKKRLGGAEKEIDSQRHHYENQAAIDRTSKVTEESSKRQFHDLRQQLERKEREISTIQEALSEARGQNEQADSLRDEVADLQAEIRSKDRQIDGLEDELELVRSKQNSEAVDQTVLQDEIQELKDKLAHAYESKEDATVRQEEMEDLKADLRSAKVKLAKDDARLGELQEEILTLKQTQNQAMEERDRAEIDLRELQDEMANKSFSTKGLSRQLEDRVSKLQDELAELHEAHDELTSEYRNALQESKVLQTKLDRLDQDREASDSASSTLVEEVDSLKERLAQVSEEKQVLQTLHKSLTTESAGLQRDLQRSAAAMKKMEQLLDEKMSGEKEVKTRSRQAELASLQAMQASIEELEESLRTKTQEVQEFGDEIVVLQNNLVTEEEKRRKRSLAAQTDMDAVAKELKASKNRLISLEKENALLQEECHQYQDRLDAQDVTEEHHAIRAQNIEHHLNRLRAEKQDLAQKLTGKNATLRQTKERVAELEAKTDELKQLLDARKNFSPVRAAQLDQETAHMRKRLVKAEGEVKRLQGERESVQAELVAVNREFDEQVEHAMLEEDRLNHEIEAMQKHMNSALKVKDKELSRASRKIKKLEEELIEAQRQAEQAGQNSLVGEDFDEMRQQLEEARRKQAELSQKHSNTVNQLKREIKNLHDKQDRRSDSSDGSMGARERHDLHKALKQAKIEAEALQIELKEKEEDVERIKVDRSFLSKRAYAAEHQQLDTEDRTATEARSNVRQLLKESQQEVARLEQLTKDQETRIIAGREKQKDLADSVERLRADRSLLSSQAFEMKKQANTRPEPQHAEPNEAHFSAQDVKNILGDLRGADIRCTGLQAELAEAQASGARLLEDLRQELEKSEEKRQALNHDLQNARSELTTVHEADRDLASKETQLKAFAARELALTAQIQALQEDHELLSEKAVDAELELEDLRAAHDALVGGREALDDRLQQDEKLRHEVERLRRDRSLISEQAFAVEQELAGLKLQRQQQQQQQQQGAGAGPNPQTSSSSPSSASPPASSGIGIGIGIGIFCPARRLARKTELMARALSDLQARNATLSAQAASTQKAATSSIAAQVGYLMARLEKEARFRKDLVHSKALMARQLAVYEEGRLRELQVLGALGYAGAEDTVVAEGGVGGREGRGRAVQRVRVVWRAVLCVVKLGRARERWEAHRGLHEQLVKALEAKKAAKARALKG